MSPVRAWRGRSREPATGHAARPRTTRVPAGFAVPVALGVGLGVALRLAFFYGATLSLGLLAWLAGQVLALWPSADPVYTRAALRTLADLRIEGLAVGGLPGAALAALAPGVFAAPERAEGAIARLVVAPGGAVLARLVAAGVAHVGVLCVGVTLLAVGLARRQRALVLAALAVQAQAALSILAARPSLDELEATGLSFAINAVLPGLSGRRVALSDLIVGVPDVALSAGLVTLALGLAYTFGGASALALVWLRRWLGWPSFTGPDRQGSQRTGSPLAACGAAALAIVLATAAIAAAAPLPAGAAGVAGRVGRAHRALPGDTVARQGPGPAPAVPAASPALRALDVAAAGAPLASPQLAAPGAGAPAPSSEAAGRDAWWRAAWPGPAAAWPGPATGPPRALSPSRVEIVGSRFQYRYLVDGRPQVIRGMGLNLQYTRLFSPAERAARLEADFAAMRALGVNTVLGWDPAEFDELLLDTAARAGLGVVVPFDLDPAADYTDPAVREVLTEQVRAWVARFKDHPALRMWGLGNEVLHKIVNPAWLGPQDPARARNARAFADWLIQTADLVHALDPAHPVTYRSAEDAFAPWVAEALRRAGGGPRPWLAWGTNVYSSYLSDVVDNWPRQGMDLPLWVSEFAPGGTSPPERPAGFREMWGYVRRYPQRVLGGAVYTWTRNGPEEIDRTMGLTDDGVPVQGDSLDMLRELFTAEPDPPP